jgi:hypothetical protein
MPNGIRMKQSGALVMTCPHKRSTACHGTPCLADRDRRHATPAPELWPPRASAPGPPPLYAWRWPLPRRRAQELSGRRLRWQAASASIRDSTPGPHAPIPSTPAFAGFEMGNHYSVISARNVVLLNCAYRKFRPGYLWRNDTVASLRRHITNIATLILSRTGLRFLSSWRV